MLNRAQNLHRSIENKLNLWSQVNMYKYIQKQSWHKHRRSDMAVNYNNWLDFRIEDHRTKQDNCIFYAQRF